MRQRDRTDWVAYLLLLLIFVALFAGLTAIGRGSEISIPFVN